MDSKRVFSIPAQLTQGPDLGLHCKSGHLRILAEFAFRRSHRDVSCPDLLQCSVQACYVQCMYLVYNYFIQDSSKVGRQSLCNRTFSWRLNCVVTSNASNTTESTTSASYLNLLLSIGRNGQLHTSIYDKRDDFNFHITNFPFLSSNIPSSPANGVFISQLIRYARACSSYECFILRARRLSSKLLKQGYLAERLKSSFRKFYGRYGDLIQQYEVSLSRMLNDILTLDQQWLPNQSDFPPISWPWYRLWPSPNYECGFHGAFATGVACQQGTLTLPDTWFRPPFWDLLMPKFLELAMS